MDKCNLNRRASDQGDICPQAREAADAAADKAAYKVFAILGVDLDKPESVEEFRMDLRFGKKLRKASDHGTLIMVAGIISGVSYAIWTGVVTIIKGH